MALLFDTSAFPAGERDDALTDFFSAAGVPIRATHREQANYSVHHYWRFGANDLFLARGAGLRLARGPHEVRVAAPEAIRVGYQVNGRYKLSTGSHDESRSTGHLNFTDLTQPCEFTQYGQQAGAMSFQVGYDQLGFSVELVRDAGRVLQSSPLYGLLQSHVARLCHTPDALGQGPAGTLLGNATIDLVRAMIASTAPAESSRRAAAITNETMHAQIITYLRTHLRDPGLGAEQIASDLHISVRHLYRLWAHRDLTLAEWVMAERLEGAKHALAGQPAQSTTIRAVARAWGFADSTHFSRRFRETYGTSPDDWRRANSPGHAAPR
jgi:AraC-like DNA-binding protein